MHLRRIHSYVLAWDKNNEELKEFRCRVGHCNVPRGFCNIGRSHSDVPAWDKKYEELKEFRCRVGHCNIP